MPADDHRRIEAQYPSIARFRATDQPLVIRRRGGVGRRFGQLGGWHGQAARARACFSVAEWPAAGRLAVVHVLAPKRTPRPVPRASVCAAVRPPPCGTGHRPVRKRRLRRSQSDAAFMGHPFSHRPIPQHILRRRPGFAVSGRDPENDRPRRGSAGEEIVATRGGPRVMGKNRVEVSLARARGVVSGKEREGNQLAAPRPSPAATRLRSPGASKRSIEVQADGIAYSSSNSASAAPPPPENA